MSSEFFRAGVWKGFVICPAASDSRSDEETWSCGVVEQRALDASLEPCKLVAQLPVQFIHSVGVGYWCKHRVYLQINHRCSNQNVQHAREHVHSSKLHINVPRKTLLLHETSACWMFSHAEYFLRFTYLLLYNTCLEITYLLKLALIRIADVVCDNILITWGMRLLRKLSVLALA